VCLKGLGWRGVSVMELEEHRKLTKGGTRVNPRGTIN